MEGVPEKGTLFCIFNYTILFTSIWLNRSFSLSIAADYTVSILAQ
jgi:hypothetical protein